MLTHIWFGFFAIAFIAAIYQWLINDQGAIFSTLMQSMNTFGVDSFVATVASIMHGSTETTFYVLAVYFGSVGIKHVRHAIGCALIADFAGITMAILAGY